MDFKDYYAALGIERTASQEVIRRAYRKLARKYHPDVSKEPDAQNRFMEVAEAHEALIDPERRAAYDDLAAQHAQAKARGDGRGRARSNHGAQATSTDWGQDYEFAGRGGEQGDRHGEAFSDFFENLFGHTSRSESGRRPPTGQGQAVTGEDQHARIDINLEDAYLGARRSFSLRKPVLDASGHITMQDREVEVTIPKGVRAGQRLRLAGMGNPGEGGAAAGDLYLEIGLRPNARFRVEGADVWTDLAVAPWEAALGATVDAPTPIGNVQLGIPADSASGRKLRLKGRGLPGKVPGDLYAVLRIVLPRADTPDAREAYAELAKAFAQYNPRQAHAS